MEKEKAARGVKTEAKEIHKSPHPGGAHLKEVSAAGSGSKTGGEPTKDRVREEAMLQTPL